MARRMKLGDIVECQTSGGCNQEPVEEPASYQGGYILNEDKPQGDQEVGQEGVSQHFFPSEDVGQYSP